ncbi:MAG: cation transporter [Planctomycetes bacterium]|nr:cation transporter [Planctomycetota bacterium]
MDVRSQKSDLYRQAGRAALVGVFVNLALGAAKLAAGIANQSFALISDSVNSLGDACTSVVVFLALRVARKPPDREHPYGHTRAEAVAASNIALLVVLSALLVGWEAIRRMDFVHVPPAAWALWLAGANVIVKEVLFHYKARVGKRTGSIALVVNAWDHRGDALCALSVLAGLAAVRWGGPGLLFADEVAALVVVSVVVTAGAVLFRRSVHELLDVQADAPFLAEIRSAATGVPGVLGVEKLLVRKTGLEFLADIHIEVDPALSVAAGHEIGHRVKDELLRRFPRIRDVLVHLEPHGGSPPARRQAT